MILYPAIDLIDGKAVRLYKGDYNRMTVYHDNPLEVAKDFAACGCTHIHMVDLEGAKTGNRPNFKTVCAVAQNTDLFVEVGGGIRTMEAVEAYLEAGVDRVILGTAAVTDEAFLKEALSRYGKRIAVGADIKDGYVAIKGWLEQSALTLDDFLQKMQQCGVSTLICTDISKDGAMAGTNRALYATLQKKTTMEITASGGVSDLEDIRALTALGLHAAIIGKAYYTGEINLKEAVAIAGPQEERA